MCISQCAGTVQRISTCVNATQKNVMGEWDLSVRLIYAFWLGYRVLDAVIIVSPWQ